MSCYLFKNTVAYDVCLLLQKLATPLCTIRKNLVSVVVVFYSQGVGWIVEVVQYICGPSWCGDLSGTIHSPAMHYIWCTGWVNKSMEPGDSRPSGKVHSLI